MRYQNGLAPIMTVVVVAGALWACNDDVAKPEPLQPPDGVEATVAGNTATVSWTGSLTAESYTVDLMAANEATRTQTVPKATTTASFSDLTPGVMYSAEVTARRGTESLKTAAVSFRVPDPRGELIKAITNNFPTSLHGTAKGMAYWYNQPNGYGAQIGVSYAGLGCGGCHAYNSALTGTSSTTPCLACHPASEADPAVANYDAVNYDKCLACHGRQAAEVAMNLPDVHRTNGMNCGSCHNATEIHGGTDKNSFLQTITTTCEDCHKTGGTAPVPSATISHNTHNSKLACQTCHMTGSVTCYNCHFNDEITAMKKTAYKRFADWTFLGNFRGKVYPMNFQSVEYNGQTFNAWGPFTGHNITAAGKTCSACHGNGIMEQYAATGAIKVTWWDAATRTIQHVSGVIPVPADYATSLRFDYVTKLTDGTWRFVETGPDRSQMLFGTPLTADQMAKLRE